MNNGEKRAAVLTALTSQNSREWTVGAGQNRYTITVENPMVRTVKAGKDVLTVDVIVRNRSGIIVYYDRVNMPDPPTAIRSGGQVVSAPLDALIDSLYKAASSATSQFTIPRLHRMPDGQFAGDTLAVRSSTADGYAADNDPTWASTQNGPGETSATTGNLQMDARTGFIIRQCFLDFNTSSLGASAIISAYVLTLYADGFGTSDADSVTIEWYLYDWGGTVTTADYRDCSPSTNITNLPKFAHMALSSWNDTAGAANDFTSDGASSSINKTGTTYMVGLFDLSYGSAPSGVNTFQMRSADEAGTTSDPLFTVTYTLPKAFPFRNQSRYRSSLRR